MALILHSTKTRLLRGALAFAVTTIGFAADEQKPNILWLTSEDMGPHIGAYGDDYATTPRLDAFARQSLHYAKASSNAPVCAAARTTLIAGMYASSTGGQHMRSSLPAPEWLQFYPVLLQEQGYYTTNNFKEDYNLLTSDKGWDESSKQAHWKNRPEGKPFFAIFNAGNSHELQIRNENPDPRHDPDKVSVPPYHPDVPEVRKDWAQYYDRISEIDAFVAERLQELEDAGLTDDTIVFFYGDHGSGMPRGKRFAGWSGLHVPLIVHVPERFRHLAPEEYEAGGVSDRLVSFVDFAPTLLSLAGARPPSYHQGRAFMGKYETEAPAYSFGFRGRMDERPDISRSVTDGRYMYIRNFLPHLPHGQALWYQQQTPTARVWLEMYERGELNKVQSAFWEPHPPEELYDLEVDPHETVNLAEDPERRKTLLRLRRAIRRHMDATQDLGFMPEPYMRSLIVDGYSPLEYARRHGAYDIEALQNLLDLQLKQRLSTADLRPYFNSASALERYWVSMIVLWKGGELYCNLEPELFEILESGRPIERVAASEAIGWHTQDPALRTRTVDTLRRYARPQRYDLMLSVHALNALDHIARRTGVAVCGVTELPRTFEGIPKWASDYLRRLIEPFDAKDPAVHAPAPDPARAAKGLRGESMEQLRPIVEKQ